MSKFLYGKGCVSPFLMTAFVYLLMIPLPAFAIACYEPSPSVVAGDNIFEYKKAETLSLSEQRTLQSFFKKIDRQWQGSANRVTCVGSELNARQVKRKTNISMEADGDYRRDMTFRSEIYNPERKTRYSEKFSLYLIDDFLRMDSRGPDGDIEIMRIATNELIFLQRYFVRKLKPAKPEEDKPVKPVPPVSIQPLPAIPINPLPSIQPVDEVTTLPIGPSQPRDGRKRNTRPAEDEQEEEVVYSPGGVLNEVVRHLVIKGRALQIETTVYTNGYLASSEKWQLR
ncbi:hypothetical protein [Endozoicomonas elysicola]|uniref:hypothetical protein n=1 Tax=Endozoicomonas elysicola TaxID=305900 RepID=UPI000AD24329|nr:hypothetical protein [Endozoicomonas elysicola]